MHRLTREPIAAVTCRSVDPGVRRVEFVGLGADRMLVRRCEEADMAQAENSPVDDGGLSTARTFGVRRLKALQLLAQHAELDDVEWTGRVELHFGGRFVKGAVLPAAREIGS